MDVNFVGHGTIDDSRAGIFLWGTSAIAQRPEYRKLPATKLNTVLVGALKA